ncbi:MAG: hypothetical protein M0R80_01065 [Proteobacteria bacterium]|jgi:hypothetical protein|nr:hypothetical protein [Pseudomonadota bacterium]
MADYTATGKITIKGCALPIKVTEYYTFPFGIGSVLYVIAKARKGVLEKVVIKKVNLTGFDGKAPVYNYVDTTNRVWFERELTWQSTAIELATNFIETEIAQYQCDENVVVSYS